MIKRLLSVGALATMLVTSAFAQQPTSRNCATMDVHNAQLQNNPKFAERMAQIEEQTNRILKNQDLARAEVTGVVTIPVVVHVVYNNSTENISAAQIQTQIDVLNEDFRAANSDVSSVPSVFSSRVADTEIEFVLDKITRTSTSVSAFGTNDQVKFSAQGGKDAENTDTKLNLWVCDISGGILGYAQFPGGPANTDGVVIDYQYFGTTGTATAPFNLGRTGTHEVGHWLNLRHIWGDGGCSVDDFVSDTPTSGNPNYGCPSLGTNSCSGGDYDMWMNYMDYVDDACMYMFTSGQKTRMRATFEAGGGRDGFAGGTGGGGGGGGGGSCVPGDVTLNLTTDNYGSETSWTVKNSAGTTLYSGSGYGNNTSYTETFTLADGDYTFTINDSYGDGICCSYGSGSYTLTDGNGSTMKSGGSFTSSEVTSFCISGSTGGGGGGGTTNVCDQTTGISGSSGTWNYYTWTVAAGTSELVVSISGGSGDADLYVRQGSSNPTTSAYDCRPYKNGNAETCTFTNPTAGTWKIGIRAYSTYSNVTLDVCSNGVPTRTARDGETVLAEAGFAAAEAAMAVYPNPVEDVLNLTMGVEIAEGSEVVIYSLSGVEALRAPASEVRNGINVAGLENGMYLISIEDAKHNLVTQKFIKQ